MSKTLTKQEEEAFKAGWSYNLISYAKTAEEALENYKVGGKARFELLLNKIGLC